VSSEPSQSSGPKWFPTYIEEILELLEEANLPPAEVQARLARGEDLRDLVRSADLQGQIFIGLGLLSEVTKAILRGNYAVH